MSPQIIKTTLLMNNVFLMYRRFRSLHDAQPVIKAFKLHNIAYQLETIELPLPSLKTMDGLTFGVFIKIKRKDFEAADAMLERISAEQLSSWSSHYLFNFTSSDLQEVVANPRDWNAHDLYIARQILKKRGFQRSIPKNDESLNDEKSRMNFSWSLRLMKTCLVESALMLSNVFSLSKHHRITY